jgi:DNA-binding Lrp family transcriptional regulator
VCTVLYYFEDMSVDEIARVLGIRVGTVKSRLYRAREKMRGALEGYALYQEWQDETARIEANAFPVGLDGCGIVIFCYNERQEEEQMKKMIALLTALLLALPLTALGEDPAYVLDMLSISVPDGYDVFVRDALGDDSPLADLYDMDYIREYFEQNPTLYLDAYHPVSGHDLMVVIVPIDGALDLSKMTDNMINVMVMPYLIAEYEAIGVFVSETSIERFPATTYVRVLATLSADGYEQYMEQYYTALTFDGAAYGVTIKVASYNGPVTEEMHEDLLAMVETVVYNAD